MHLHHLKDTIPIGYQALIEQFNLQVIPHYRRSFITFKGAARVIYDNHFEIHIYPKQYLPKENDVFAFLEFAVKYDGINLEILKAIFGHIEPIAMAQYVRNRPTSKLARRLWYLFEFLTQQVLDVPDAQGGNYVHLLEEDKYYTCLPIRSRRHYVDDNLLGNHEFCPLVRKTSALLQFEQLKLSSVAEELIRQYPPLVISRAIHYLYAKETMSSYEIERERPDKKRMTRFVELLKESEHLKILTKEKLIELQNQIVDARFADKDYRNYQNYIGEQRDWYRQIIHYIPPLPEDVSDLMNGLLSCFERMRHSPLNPIIIAAVLSFGFVFIHPFEDGNGRIHRFLIHHVLSTLHFTPLGVIFPVSATILKDMKSYDRLLESFSIPLLQIIQDYELNDKGELKVNKSTKDLYAYIDYTHIAEFLFACVEKTIHTDFREELNYIAHYDQVKTAIQEVIDMPDKKIDLFIQIVSQNQGRLSAKKKESYFNMLTEEEIAQLEQIVQEYILSNPSHAG